MTCLRALGFALVFLGCAALPTQAQSPRDTEASATARFPVALIAGFQFDRVEFNRPEQRFGSLTLLSTSSSGSSYGGLIGIELFRLVAFTIEPAVITFEDDRPSDSLVRTTFGVRLSPRLGSTPLAPYVSIGHSLVTSSDESDGVTTRGLTLAGGAVATFGSNVGISLNVRRVPLVSEDRFEVESSVLQYGIGLMLFVP